MGDLDKKLRSYFKVGDLVMNPDIWDNKRFVVESFHGNAYLPLMTVHFYKKPIHNGNRCLFDIRTSILLDSNSRPLKNIDNKVLAKLYVKKNYEAVREFTIRKNLKKYV